MIVDERKFIWIDLGGTSIKIGLVNEQGVLMEQQSVPTRKKAGYQGSNQKRKGPVQKHFRRKAE